MAPKTGVVGTTVNVTLKGTALHSRDVVRLTVAGKPAITGTMRSVSADRTTSVYAFNLAGAALGVRDVSVKSYAGATVTVAGATKSTLALTTARANRSLYAAVTCVRTGYASGRAVSNSVTVRA